MEIIQLLGSVTGLAFVSGMNLYAAVLTTGLGIRFGFVSLPSDLTSLSVLGEPYVLIAAGIAYLFEFFADKIPWADSLWDMIHTFVRPLGTVLICMKGIGNVDPGTELALIILGGSVTLFSHTSKASLRFVANHSPEPFSNIGLSLAEDVCVVGGSWAAFNYPLEMLAICVIFLAVFIFFAPKIFRLLRVEILALRSVWNMTFGRKTSEGAALSDEIPDDLRDKTMDDIASEEETFCVRCVSGKGMKTGRNNVGFLYMTGDRLSFVTRKNFRIRKADFNISDIRELKFYKKNLLDHIVFSYGKNKVNLHLFKNRYNKGKRIIAVLESVTGKLPKGTGNMAGEFSLEC
ncbi:DUF4126 domain-containing protein [Desulfococcaceae bacterium HSG8]|nr:DUF4126 domain-containing protein [Desulfococcaceae bacterium HSG8]